jgi:hypothetical protein
VRHELGASYDLHAQLANQRLAAVYTLAGEVEAGRASEALDRLARDLATLRSDPDAAARAFVTARARVVTRLRSLAGGAATLAGRVEQDIALGRAPLSDLETADAVAALTIDELVPALADLDLARAAVSLRGPEPALGPAFAALGRTPHVLAARPSAARPSAARPDPSPPAAGARASQDELTESDIRPAITEGAPAQHTALSLAAGYTSGSIYDLDVSGLTVAGQLGYRFDETNTAGLHLELGRLAGDYTYGIASPMMHTLSTIPIELAGFAQATAYDRVWGAAFLGLHLTRVSDTGITQWESGIGYGLAAGIDVYKLGPHRFALYGRIQGELLTDQGFAAFTAGLAYRR